MLGFPEYASACRVPHPPPGWSNYDYTVLSDGSLGLVRIDRDVPGMAKHEQFSAWPETRLRLSSLRDGVESEAVETGASVWPIVNRLADGRWIVVGARCQGGDRNARIIDVDGLDACKFEVGDHAISLACTASGAVLVGYGDESTGGDLPAGAGLASFNAAGACQWTFDAEGYFISDCYALSVTGEDVWTCTYDEFPIIRVRDGGLRFWTNELRGAHAIASDGDHVILAGGYPRFEGIDSAAEDDRIALLRLEAARAVVVAELRCAVMAERDTFFCGHDGVLHVVAHDEWLRLTVKDWVRAVR